MLVGAQLNKTPLQYCYQLVAIATISPDPENDSKICVWTTQFVCIEQILETTTSRYCKGLFPVEMFQYYYEFGQEHI